jgi:hypothetical protein
MLHIAPPTASQPLLLSFARSVLKVVGSLFLTVGILILLIAIMVMGTFIEKGYGATGAKFGVYGSWWFNTLGFILGCNSAASLILHWPWKRQQLGFVIPHLGLIVLLVGCFLSREYGVEASLIVDEGETSNLAFKGTSQHVELDGQQHFTLNVIPADPQEKTPEPVTVRFTSGPFNWEDFHNGTLGFFPWSLAHRDEGVLYDHDGIRLEVLDYLSDSEIVNLPSLTVRAAPLGPDGKATSEPGKELRLSVNADPGPAFADLPFGTGSEQTLAGGARILFWMTGSPQQTAAFRHSQLSGPVGKLGRVVLYAAGKPYEFSVSDWKQGTRRPLGDSGLEAELVGFGAIQVDVQRTDQVDEQILFNIHNQSQSHQLLLSANFPEIYGFPDYQDEVFGSYWLGLPPAADESQSNPDAAKPDAAKPDAAQAGKDATPKGTEATVKSDASKSDAAKPAPSADSKAEAKTDPQAKQEAPATFPPPRIEFLQGADQRLYLRTWRAGKVGVFGPLRMSESGGRISVFKGTPDALDLWFGDFHSAERPDFAARPLPFVNSEDSPHVRQAYVRLTVDDQSDEFWMVCDSPEMRFSKKLLQRTVVGKGRRVTLGLAAEQFQLGYAIHLRKAWRKLDPGTRQASFYGSEIDLIPVVSSTGSLGKAPPKYENLLVTLNAPLDIADPGQPGRSYRLFQASMTAVNPQDPQSVYRSGFTLNYDPGRGLTYVGCLLIVGGIFVAYFVKFSVRSRSLARSLVKVDAAGNEFSDPAAAKDGELMTEKL